MTSRVSKKKYKAPVILITYIFIALLTGFLTVLYFSCANDTLRFGGDFPNLIKIFLSKTDLVQLSLFYSLVIYFILILLYFFGKSIGNFIYKYQVIIGLVFILVCSFTEVNTSSIGILNEAMGKLDTDRILNDNLGLRGDEYAISTPLLLSQYENDFGYFSDIPQGTEKVDMYVTSGSPVKDILILFRPFQIAFLFLPFTNAFSFYFSARLVAILMTSFWFGMLLTKRKKSLSFLLSLLISFSVSVQSWFYAANLIEMLISGMGLVMSLHAYMLADSDWKRNLLTLLMIYLGATYLLVLYPAWQVPFFYVFIFLGISYLITDWKKADIKTRDYLRLGIMLLSIGLVLLYFFYKSGDTIKLQSESLYPGLRKDNYGGGFTVFGYDLANYLIPFTRMFDQYLANNLLSNYIEITNFISFFPFGLLLSVYNLIVNRRKNLHTVFLILAELFLGAYAILGFPEWLGKITLMNLSFSNRTRLAIGFINVLLFVQGLADQKRNVPVILCIIFSLSIVVLNTFSYLSYFQWFIPKDIFCYICILTFIIGLLYFFYSYGKLIKKVFLFVMVFFILIHGLVINPVRIGLNPLINNKVYKDVKEIVEIDPDAIWLLHSVKFTFSNFFPAAGARTVNSTNIYPNIDVWSKLDPTGKYETVYNRFADVDVVLTTEPTKFTLNNVNAFTVDLNIDDLEKLNVKYVYGRNEDDLSTLSNDNVILRPFKKTDLGMIYRVIYPNKEDEEEVNTEIDNFYKMDSKRIETEERSESAKYESSS